MTVHFAAARTAEASVVARILQRPARDGCTGLVANDNGGEADVRAQAARFDAALRHFGQYGLRAASVAADAALAAHGDSDAASAAHWLDICRLLDCRLARRTEGAMIARTA
ncbi:MAG: hypothetical protein WA954_03990 [Parerythrobacter sp.]